MDDLVKALGAEALAPIESALRELAERRAWGHVIVHFERGRAVSVVLHESRKLKAKTASFRLASDEVIEPAA